MAHHYPEGQKLYHKFFDLTQEESKLDKMYVDLIEHGWSYVSIIDLETEDDLFYD